MIPFSIIVAIDEHNGIGKEGQLPWHLPADLKHFKNITTQTQSSAKQNIVIMGRKTWESIPERFRPLSGRVNVVLSHQEKLDLPEEVLHVKSFDEALNLFDQKDWVEKSESIFVIGGEQIFKLALAHEACHKLFLTHIQTTFECDTFLPVFEDVFKQATRSDSQTDGELSYYFAEYNRT